LEFGEEVVFLCVEVFDLSFEPDDFTINAGDNIGFGDLDIIRARSDFSFGGLRVDCDELKRAIVIVTNVTDGDGGKVVERVNGDDYSGEGVIFAAVGFDENLDTIPDTKLGDLFSLAEVDFEFCSVDFNNAGVGCGFHCVCWFVVWFNPLRGSVCLALE